MADEEIPNFDLMINDRVPKSAAQARESAREARDSRKFTTSVNNEMARENRWEEEVNRELKNMPLSEERDKVVRIFLLAKAMAYEKKKEKKSSQLMTAAEAEKIYEKAKVKAAELIKKEDAATAKREKASKKGGRKTRKHGKKGKKYTKKSRRGRKHKTRKFKTYF